MSKRPAVFATVAALVMIVIAIPFFSMRLGSADAGTDPSSTTTRKAYDLLAKGFGPGYNGPLELVAQINSPSQLAAFKQGRGRRWPPRPGWSARPAVHVLAPGHGRPTVAIANVYPKGSPQAASTSDLLSRVRNHGHPGGDARAPA